MQEKFALSLLGVSTVGSVLAAAGTVVVLNPEDRISVGRGLTLTGLGFVFFLSLWDLLNRVAFNTALGAGVRRKYRLTCGEVLDISNKLVSAVQAALSVVTGAVVCLWSCTRDLLHASHYMSEAYAWFGAAYFFYDIWSMYRVHIHMRADKVLETKKIDGPQGHRRKPSYSGDVAAGADGPPAPVDATGDAAARAGDGDATARVESGARHFLRYCRDEPVILMHHLFIGGFGFLFIVYLRKGLGDCIFGYVYLMELSTPFVSMRSVLSRLRLKSSRVYVVNGLTMLATFFVTRIVSLPYVMYMYSRVVNKSYFEAMRSLPTGCQISITLLLLPQVYWFCLMSKGAVKVLFLDKPAGAASATGAGKKRS